jgi:DNA-binding protein YbaB
VPQKQTDDDIVATCRKRLKLAEEAEREIRAEALVDLRFAAGQQWDADDERRRKATGAGGSRPCLTFNKLTGPLAMVANEARMNKPGMQVLPVDSTGDKDTALVIEGMIRHIEYASKAEQVYETALEQSTKGAIGAFKVTTRYCGNKTFDQELRIERVTNQFSIYTDPFAKAADKSDMMWAVELEWFSREEYEAEFGDDTDLTKARYFDGVTNPAPEWVGREGVQIARYWYVDIETKTLAAIRWPDGKITNEYTDSLPADLPPGCQYATDDAGDRIEREDQIRHIRMCRLNGIEVLDKTEWKGQWIPILIVPGEEMYIEDKRHVFSLIRFARDPQKLYNFYRSSEAETVMLGTKAPWIGAKGVFKDPRWATANSVPWAYLEYEPLDIAGNPAPPPQRNLAEPPIQALSFGAAQASDDIKATTNIYDASLGAMSNETSGVAIRQRQSQGGFTNFHFIDNLNRAILHCGTILCDLIPKIYDTPRQVRILGEDMEQQVVAVNQVFTNEWNQEQCHDLKAGKYDVRLKIGPAYKTQQEQAAETLTQLAQAYPPLMQIAGDLVFKNLNFKGSDEIAQRLARSLPPHLQDQPGKPQEMLLAENQQMAQQLEQMQMALQQANEEIRTKRIEMESRERMETAKIESSDRQAALDAQVKLVTTEAQLKSREDISALSQELALLKMQIASMASGAAAEGSVGPSSSAPDVEPAADTPMDLPPAEALPPNL